MKEVLVGPRHRLAYTAVLISLLPFATPTPAAAQAGEVLHGRVPLVAAARQQAALSDSTGTGYGLRFFLRGGAAFLGDEHLGCGGTYLTGGAGFVYNARRLSVSLSGDDFFRDKPPCFQAKLLDRGYDVAVLDRPMDPGFRFAATARARHRVAGWMILEAGPSLGVFTGGSTWLGVSAAAVLPIGVQLAFEIGRDQVLWKSHPNPAASKRFGSHAATLTLGLAVPVGEAFGDMDFWGF